MLLRRRLLLALGSVMLAILCLELPAVVGFVDYRRWLVPAVMLEQLPPWQNPRLQVDQDGTIVRPLGLVTGEVYGDLVALLGLPGRTPYHYAVQYDRRGFRNAQNLETAPVVAVGDSFLESGKLSQEELLTSIMSDTLSAPVANLGRSAIGPQQELAILKRSGLPLQPRLVLWLFFEGNDLRDAVAYQAFTTRSAFDAFRARSFLNAVALGLWPHLGLGQAADADRRVCRLPDGSPLWLWYPGAPLAETDLAGLEIAERALAEARAATTAAAARLALVFVPTTWRVYHDRCVFPADSDLAGWTLSDLPARLASFAAEQQMAYLDLTPALRERALVEALYFPDDTHWNAAGNRVAAAALADHVLHSARP